MKAILNNLILFLNNNIVSYIPSYSVRYAYYKYIMNYKIGKNAAIHMGVKFLSKSNFKIGENSVINQSCLIDNRGGIIIEDNVTLGHGVKLITADHNIHSDEFEGRNRPIIIKNHVFIGTSAIVLGGVVMEIGSVVGAGSVLTKSSIELGVYAGVPAKYLFIRKSNLKYQQDYKRLFF